MIRALALLLALTTAALARDPLGLWAQYSPQQRDLLRKQTTPDGKWNCCSEADGVHAEEDIRDGHYWVRFVAWPGQPYEKQVDWTRVPDESVITRGNPIGSPVVWFYWESGAARIRCYSPGAKL